jgi:hypothetical protein
LPQFSKKRKHTNNQKSSNLINNETFFFFKDSFFLNLKFFFFLKKNIRKFFRKKRKTIFVLLKPNFILRSKSKNSRMGKGIGKPVKLFFFCKNNTPVLIFKKLTLRRKLFLKFLIQKFLKKKIFFVDDY